jgi:hypothetical protein
MIEIEILTCPDKDFLGTFKFDRNIISIGHPSKNINCDLLINDPKIEELKFLLQLDSSKLIFKPLIENSKTPFWLNGKKESSVLILKINDRLKIGDTLLHFKNFTFTALVNKQELIDNNLTNIFKDESLIEVKNIIDLLEQDLN